MAGIFKAYDVRGVYPTEIDEATAEKIGAAFGFLLDDADRAAGGPVVVSRDMRAHSEPLAAALVEGLRAAGLDVVDVGLATTPMNYFAVGHLGAAGGIQVTASHNPAKYNGMKLSLREARPVSGWRRTTGCTACCSGWPKVEASWRALSDPTSSRSGAESAS